MTCPAKSTDWIVEFSGHEEADGETERVPRKSESRARDATPRDMPGSQTAPNARYLRCTLYDRRAKHGGMTVYSL